jgi:hypothetical protein
MHLQPDDWQRMLQQLVLNGPISHGLIVRDIFGIGSLGSLGFVISTYHISRELP